MFVTVVESVDSCITLRYVPQPAVPQRSAGFPAVWTRVCTTPAFSTLSPFPQPGAVLHNLPTSRPHRLSTPHLDGRPWPLRTGMTACAGVSLRCAPGRASRAVGNDTTVANGAEPPPFRGNDTAVAPALRGLGPPGANPSRNRGRTDAGLSPSSAFLPPRDDVARRRPVQRHCRSVLHATPSHPVILKEAPRGTVRRPILWRRLKNPAPHSPANAGSHSAPVLRPRGGSSGERCRGSQTPAS